jgi:hypothetical protein
MAAQRLTPRGDPRGGWASGRVCAGTKRDGSPCNAVVTPGEKWCWNHNPAHAEARRRNASKAGKSKPSNRVKELDAQLAKLYEDTLEGAVDRGVAAVLCQIVYGRARLLELERRIQEVEQFEERVAELEALVAAQRQTGGTGGRRW